MKINSSTPPIDTCKPAVFSGARAAIAALCLLLGIAGPAAGSPPDWMFRQGYFSHAPTTGARVVQYAPLPLVEALPDARPWMSGYHRSRVTQRGPDGTVDEYYRVENWTNAGGGLDAQWERFHDAWRQSVLSGGFSVPYGSPAAPYWWPGTTRWPWGGYGPGPAPGYAPPPGSMLPGSQPPGTIWPRYGTGWGSAGPTTSPYGAR